MTSSTSNSKSQASQMARGGVLTYLVKVAAVGLGFLTQLLIARSLGKAGYGDFSFAVTTLNFLVVFAVAGSDVVATRFVSTYRDSPQRLLPFLKWLNARAFLLSAILLVVTLVALQCVKPFDGRAIWLVTQVACIALPIQVFAVLRQGVLRGRQRPVLSVIPDGFARPTSMLLLLGIVLLSGDFFWGKFSPVHAAALLVLSTIATLLVGQWMMNRELSEVKSQLFEEGESETRLWKSMAFASMFSAAAMIIHAQCDIWMLGVLTSGDYVGPYTAAAKYATFVIFGINAINTALGPMLAKNVDDKTQMQILVSRGVAIAFGLAAVVGAVLLAFPSFALNLFGDGFDSATIPLCILVGGNLFNVACGSVGLILSMTGHHGTFMKVLVLSMVLNIALNAFLIPQYQSMGAAIATTISVVIWNVSALICVKVKLGIRPAIGGLI